jgi:hypothetical protein
LDTFIRAVTVRRLQSAVAGANWIVVTANEVADHPEQRHEALQRILPAIRARYDLREDES